MFKRIVIMKGVLVQSLRMCKYDVNKSTVEDTLVRCPQMWMFDRFYFIQG